MSTEGSVTDRYKYLRGMHLKFNVRKYSVNASEEKSG